MQSLNVRSNSDELVQISNELIWSRRHLYNLCARSHSDPLRRKHNLYNNNRSKISGAHINPAASLAFALDGKLDWKMLPVYLGGQYLGGFLAALVLYINYYEAINSIDSGAHKAFNSSSATGQVFATYPAQYVTIWGALMDQMIGTGILLFSLSAVCDKQNASLEQRHQPLVVAFVIGIICVAFSPNCGAIFNPARDVTPRLLTFLVGYDQVWQPLDGRYWFVAGIVGPHLGAIIGVFAYKLLIGSSINFLALNNFDVNTGPQQPMIDNSSPNTIDTMRCGFQSRKHQQHHNISQGCTLPMGAMVDGGGQPQQQQQRQCYSVSNNNNPIQANVNANANQSPQRALVHQRQHHDVDYGSTS